MSRDHPPYFSRRAVVRAGMLASLGAALPGGLFAADSKVPPITKAIPSTGERLPVMGVGTNHFGRADFAEVSAVLRRMAELGGTVIDTAAGYGDSEAVIGKALKEQGLRKKMFIATKLTPNGSPNDPVGGKESFERSLQRLGNIDLIFVHHVDGVEQLMPLIVDLKKQRRVRYIGFTSISSEEYPQVLQYLRKYPVDFLQTNYAIADRAAEAEVLPLARERKVAVMVATPFGGGRAPLLPRTQGHELPQWAADFGATTWGQFLLKYVLSHPAVTCAIPGTTQVTHLEDDQAAGRGRLPDAAMRKKMEDYWDKSFKS
jgi:aryl-alcohol dehydrogenase-like predicted oxidoreductase